MTSTPSASGCVRLLAAALLAAGCAAPRPRSGETGGGAPAAAQSAPANLVVTLSEVIERADVDGLSYATVYLDGKEAGRTQTAPRSREKRWEGRAEPGNHPLRLELWVLPGLGEWRKLPDSQQPRERFARVDAGGLTRVEVRRDAAGAYDFQTTHER